jgi:hypothetical protein
MFSGQINKKTFLVHKDKENTPNISLLYFSSLYGIRKTVVKFNTNTYIQRAFDASNSVEDDYT